MFSFSFWKNLIMPRFFKIALRIIAAFVSLYIVLAILGAVLLMHIPLLPVNGFTDSAQVRYPPLSLPVGKVLAP